MTKRIFALILICIIGCIALICFMDDIDYIKNRDNAKEYVKVTYGSDFKFIKGAKGQSPWLNSRIDKFIFHDEKNDFFFCVKNSYGQFTDDYANAKSGKAIDDVIHKLLDEKYGEFFIVKSMVYENVGTHTEIVILLKNKHNYYSDVYTSIKKIVAEYPDINIKLIISDEIYKERYIEYYTYKSNERLTDIPFEYLGNLSASDLNVSSEQEFIETLELNRIIAD